MVGWPIPMLGHPTNSLRTEAPPDMGTFLPVDGGQDRACRGASVNDNNPQHYTARGLGPVTMCSGGWGEFC